MVELRAFIFDVDGTLADTERDGHRLAFNRAFAEAGLSWEWSVDVYGALLEVTGGKERIQHYIDHYSPPFQPPADLKAFIAQLHAAKTKSYTQLLAEGSIPLRPGVKRVLQEARHRGIRLAIATTTTPANVTALLENTLQPEGSSWFEVIAAGDIVPQKKPAADIYYYTLQQLGLEARECLAFEDSFNGLVSALKAGIQTVITVNEYTQAQNFSGASLVLNHLGEPTLPFQVLSGRTDGSSYFTVDLAHFLHQQRF
jgi:HAD superfamily hydrolase (TIGR01509 family)